MFAAFVVLALPAESRLFDGGGQRLFPVVRTFDGGGKQGFPFARQALFQRAAQRFFVPT